jgi:response regulator RpfG family c-di-GMP phosphodiesterase
VMTAAVEHPRTAELALAKGVDGYLIRPFTTSELLVTVTNALERRQLEADRHGYLSGAERIVDRAVTLSSLLRELEDPEAGAGLDADRMARLSRSVSLGTEESLGHLERVSRFAALLAEAVGYRDSSLERLRLAAALHDVGKIGVPDAVLLKPASLSPLEHAAMQRHAQIGYKLLARSDSGPWGEAPAIAMGHHEWWEGGGYPLGLSGDQIPEAARIAAVADVFDALTTDHVYRAARSVEEAIGIMTELRGRQFEPRLLDAFLERAGEAEAIRVAYPEPLSGEARIRVLVIDDDEVFVAGVVRLLGIQPSLEVVGTAGSVAESQVAVARLEPDVVLMDFELPDGDGIAATAMIRALSPAAKVVMLTGRADQDAFVRAMGAGCAGFVTKTEAAEKVVEAVRDAYKDDTLSRVTDLPELLRRLSPTRRGLGSDLGTREIEVLRLVADGLANKAIAERLHLSVHTVRNHVQSVLHKLNAHSRLEAIATAVREGVIAR